MKPILYTLLLLFFIISCDKEKSIEKITINGIVSDTSNNRLDSVKITLEETCFMCMGALPIETKYSKDGIFKFEFTLRKEHSYHLDFEKKGYIIKSYHGIENNKETQYFNIIMQKAEE